MVNDGGVNPIAKYARNTGSVRIRAMFSSRIFRSRWVALLWAAGIIWTAIDIAEANKAPEPASNAADATDATDALGQPVTDHDLAILANAMN